MALVNVYAITRKPQFKLRLKSYRPMAAWEQYYREIIKSGGGCSPELLKLIREIRVTLASGTL
jgi:hypothetical protein